ncbi:MAG TPA: MBL fold metallo-hydrolase [Bryobacteraceae bacterium]|nr:MBL fold metallo-hydrolase [Bryobacteraceae bacterium]
MADANVRLRFWGVRGSTPTPTIENLTFGGNTSCVEVRTADNQVIILDAGSGIRNLGQSLMKEAAGQPIAAHVFLTHFHWDHIQGVPFFAPIYGPKNTIAFHSGIQGRPLQETLEGQMAQPYFPVKFDQVAAQRSFHTIAADAEVQVGAARVIPFELNHPQGATGYRIEVGNTKIVYATDYEHGDTRLDEVLRRNVENADILICDSQYTPAEYEAHRGWGHSTWLNAVQLARDAGVRRLFLFHHDPTHDDQTMMRISEDARMHFENAIAAWEGFVAVL